MRKRGRHTNDRLRAMRFALWAQQVPTHLLTVNQISGLLDLHKTAAAKWRRDLLQAMSPIEIEGVPMFLTPNPLAQSANTGGNRSGLTPSNHQGNPTHAKE